MLKRTLPLIALLFVPAVARADEPQPAQSPPALVVRLASLDAPDKIFTVKAPGLLSLTLRLGQIPEGVRTMLLDGLKEGLGKAEDKPGETKAQKAFRVALTKEIQRIVENVLKDGDELN